MQAQVKEGPMQRWLVISQLRRALSSSDWEPKILASPSCAGLTTADWCWVFTPPCGTTLEDSMLLHSRAPVPGLLAPWLHLLQIIDSPALGVFVLCIALPHHCR